MSLRLAEGKLVSWIDVRQEVGFSNFVFVDKNYGADPVMRRIFSLARQHSFRSILIEEIDCNCNEILEGESEALKTRNSDFTHSTVHRISFLKTLKDTEPQAKDFIGSVIFKSDSFSGLPEPKQHVYEALVPPVRTPAHNNFIHCLREYQFKTFIGTFAQTGALYAQQNDLTFVCAHVALRTALSALLPEGDITYRRINELAGVDHRAVQVGDGRGLDPEQMEAVLSGLGIPYEKIIHEPNEGLLLPSDYQRYLYGAIESGAPALLGFQLNDPSAPPGNGGRHIIPILGHTFNEDTWVPGAQMAYFESGLSFYSSETWLSTFVVHDDNFGPYYCLPRNFLTKDNFRLILSTKRIPTLLTAVAAESIAFGYARRLSDVFAQAAGDWLVRFSIFGRMGSLVIRTHCIERDEYIAHLQLMRDWTGNKLNDSEIDQIGMNLPQSFWIAELSAPELFSATRHKFGEIIIASDKPAAVDFSLLIAARLPTVAIIRKDGDLKIIHSAITSHTPLLCRRT